MSLTISTARRRKRKAVDQPVVATPQDADGSQETIEGTIVEIAASGVKKQRAKKAVVERGDALRPSYAIQTFQGMHGRWSGDSLIKAASPTRSSETLIHTMLIAVLYTTDLRAPKLDEAAVRMLSWNVASLRSSLKKVQTSAK